jgi:hypothetical protein
VYQAILLSLIAAYRRYEEIAGPGCCYIRDPDGSGSITPQRALSTRTGAVVLGLGEGTDIARPGARPNGA